MLMPVGRIKKYLRLLLVDAKDYLGDEGKIGRTKSFHRVMRLFDFYQRWSLKCFSLLSFDSVSCRNYRFFYSLNLVIIE